MRKVALIILLLVFGEFVHAQSSPEESFGSVIFNRENLLGSKLVHYSLQLDDNGNQQKLLIQPFRFQTAEKNSFIRQIRFNFFQQNGQTTVGVGMGFNREKEEQNDSEGFFQFIVGLNATLFNQFGSPSRDNNEDSLIDNEYSIAALSYSMGFLYKFNRSLVSFSTHFIQEREFPIEGTEEVNSVGYALSYARKWISFSEKFDNEQWGESALDFGVTLEHLLPIENGGALTNANFYRLAISPFLLFELNPYASIRFSAPFEVIEGNQDERGFGPFFMVSLKL